MSWNIPQATRTGLFGTAQCCQIRRLCHFWMLVYRWRKPSDKSHFRIAQLGAIQNISYRYMLSYLWWFWSIADKVTVLRNLATLARSKFVTLYWKAPYYGSGKVLLCGHVMLLVATVSERVIILPEQLQATLRARVTWRHLSFPALWSERRPRTGSCLVAGPPSAAIRFISDRYISIYNHTVIFICLLLLLINVVCC